MKCRWGINLPTIVGRSISILSDGGLGMAMFSIGTMDKKYSSHELLEYQRESKWLNYSYCTNLTGVFMASQASIIACGTRKAILAMALKFVLGPVLMAISSIAVGLRGKLLKLAIVQVKVYCFSVVDSWKIS